MNHYWLRNDRITCHVAVMDEAGKLDLNVVREETLQRLLRVLGVSRSRAESVARSVVAWRTPGSEPGASAAPRRPYRFVEELLRVPGVSRELFHGRPARQEDGKVAFRRGLADFVTVYSGSSRINVNYAEPEVLAALPGRQLGQGPIPGRGSNDRPVGRGRPFRPAARGGAALCHRPTL